MTNKEAIEILRSIRVYDIYPKSASEETKQAIEWAIKVLDSYKPLCPVDFPTEDDPYPVCTCRLPQDWIPVNERLPEDMQRVLIWFEYYRYGDFNCMYQTYGFGYVCDGKWSPFINGETGWQDYRIIAWQPLPEPYKEEGAE